MPKMSMKKPKLGPILLGVNRFNAQGFISLPLSVYIAIGAFAIITGVSAYAQWQKSRYESVKHEYALFKSNVEALGKAAKLRADAENKLNLERKVKADESLRKLRIANESLNKRLRDNAGRSVLPDPGPSPGSAETACFGRPDLDGALQRFIGGTTELIISGQQAVDALNNAKDWAKD